MTQSILLFLAVLFTLSTLLWFIEYAQKGTLTRYIVCLIMINATALFWALFYAAKN